MICQPRRDVNWCQSTSILVRVTIQFKQKNKSQEDVPYHKIDSGEGYLFAIASTILILATSRWPIIAALHYYVYFASFFTSKYEKAAVAFFGLCEVGRSKKGGLSYYY